jgi:hypothetical protein
MKVVLHTPPSASESSRVSFDSRYGMCGDAAASALITRPSASSDLLMLPASALVLPVACERFVSSLPARSTTRKSERCSYAGAAPPSAAPCVKTPAEKVTMRCERFECLFIAVSATKARSSASASSATTSSTLVTATCARPSTSVPRVG